MALSGGGSKGKKKIKDETDEVLEAADDVGAEDIVSMEIVRSESEGGASDASRAKGISMPTSVRWKCTQKLTRRGKRRS